MAALVVLSDTVTRNTVRGVKRSYQFEKHVIIFTSGAAADTYDFTLDPLIAPCVGGGITVVNNINAASAIHTFVVNPPEALVTTAALYVSLASATGATVAPTVKHIFGNALINSNAVPDYAFGQPNDVWKVRDTLSGASLAANDTITAMFLRVLLD